MTHRKNLEYCRSDKKEAYAKAYFGPCQTSMMELFCEHV